MKEKSQRERTPFGQRLLAARKKAGLSQEKVCAALGISQSGLSELEREANSSGYTAQLAALYGVDPYELAEGTGLRGGFDLDQLVSQARPYSDPPKLKWGDLMTADLSRPFELDVMDGAFGGDYPQGCVMRLDPARSARAGWPVLVKDRTGIFYLRDYQEGSAGRWQAVARVRGFAPLDSVDDGLEVVAVMRGVDYP